MILILILILILISTITSTSTTATASNPALVPDSQRRYPAVTRSPTTPSRVVQQSKAEKQNKELMQLEIQIKKLEAQKKERQYVNM